MGVLGTTNYPAADDPFDVPTNPATTPLASAGDANRTHSEFLADLGALVTAIADATSDRLRTGMTGATGATRYVGRTDSGPPASGTFLQGDFVVDVTLKTIWVCTTAGSPGSWSDLSSGQEYSYVQITSNPTAVTGNTAVDITGLTITFVAGSRPIEVSTYCMGALNNTATARTENLFITDDSNNVKQTGKLYLAASSLSGSVHPVYRFSPTPGATYTFKVRAQGSNAASNFTLQAGATYPMFLQAKEV